MVQSSGPISQGTNAERQMTDVLWRDLFGDESGVIGDTNGTAYLANLSTDSNLVYIGSGQIDSVARVAGFAHRIPVLQAEPIDIPVASGVARTDIIALRYDPTYTGAPGPVRLVRIAGTSSALPAYDDAPPGVEDLPLWAITRSPGQTLAQATLVRMFPRIAHNLSIPDVNAALPNSSPLGTLLRRGTQRYERRLDGSGNPVWVADSIATSPAALSLLSGVNNAAGIKGIAYWREERTAFVSGTVTLSSALNGLASRAVADVPAGFRPNATVTQASNLDARFQITSGGRIDVVNGSINQIPANVALPLHLIIPLG